MSKRTDETAVEQVETTEEVKPPSLTDFPGVLAVRIPQEDGSQQITVVEINGHDPLATPILLEAAAKVKREQLNLN